MTQLKEIGLASRSPRRRELLAMLGVKVVVLPSAFEEPAYEPRLGDIAEFARNAAIQKARLAQPDGPQITLAADTLVVLDGRVFGKPSDAAAAIETLRALSGRTHTVHTGFAVVDRGSGALESGVESASVTFMPLDAQTIERYVQTGDPLDKAGAYGIQGLGALLVASIEGDYYAVMGLPLARVGCSLKQLGYRIL